MSGDAAERYKQRANDIKKPLTLLQAVDLYGVPKGSRTPVTAVKGRCPRPLDDGDMDSFLTCSGYFFSRLNQRRAFYFNRLQNQENHAIKLILVELGRIELPTSTLPVLRSPS